MEQQQKNRISTDYSLIMNETHNCFFDTNFSTDPNINMSFLTQIIKIDINSIYLDKNSSRMYRINLKTSRTNVKTSRMDLKTSRMDLKTSRMGLKTRFDSILDVFTLILDVLKFILKVFTVILDVFALILYVRELFFSRYIELISILIICVKKDIFGSVEKFVSKRTKFVSKKNRIAWMNVVCNRTVYLFVQIPIKISKIKCQKIENLTLE